MNSTAIGLGVWHSGLTLSLALIFVGATSAAAQSVAPPEAAAQTVTPVPQTPEARAAEERAQAHPAEPEWFLEPTIDAAAADETTALAGKRAGTQSSTTPMPAWWSEATRNVTSSGYRRLAAAR